MERQDALKDIAPAREPATREAIAAQFAAARDLMAVLCNDLTLIAAIEAVTARAVECLRGGGTILLAGNGGSAADAQHIAAELVGRFAHDRPGLAAIALTTDTSALTAIANDHGFERVFARQVEALGRRGDVLIAISTSGRSPNIIAALQAARARGVITIGLCGQTPGPMGPWCDHVLAIPSANTPRIQEAQILVGHIICGLIEQQLHPRQRSPE
jgi:D-sedoheptulose 7-phosphate isomerase